MKILIEDEDYEPIIDITAERDGETNNFSWSASKPTEWHCHEGTIYNHESGTLDLVQKILTSIGKI